MAAQADMRPIIIASVYIEDYKKPSGMSACLAFFKLFKYFIEKWRKKSFKKIRKILLIWPKNGQNLCKISSFHWFFSCTIYRYHNHISRNRCWVWKIDFRAEKLSLVFETLKIDNPEHFVLPFFVQWLVTFLFFKIFTWTLLLSSSFSLLKKKNVKKKLN